MKSFIKQLWDLLTENAITKLSVSKSPKGICIYTKQVAETLTLKSNPELWGKLLSLLEENDFIVQINEEPTRKQDDKGIWRNYDPCVFISPSSVAKSADDLLSKIDELS